jgi:hypothetical protein
MMLVAFAADAFALRPRAVALHRRSHRSQPLPTRPAALRMASDDEEEIAALEAKLSALKQAKQEEVAEEEAAAAAAAAESFVEADEGFDFTTMSCAPYFPWRPMPHHLESCAVPLSGLRRVARRNRKKVAASQSAVAAELLSEAWKEEEEEPSAGLPVAPLAAAFVLIAAFSQVPIGQENLDLATYGGKEVRLESPSEIKARYDRISGALDEDE